MVDAKLFDVAQPEDTQKYNSFASPTPVIEEGRVYVHFGSYGTAALDTATGKPLWTRRDLPCNHWRGPGSSPILYEDLLIVHLDGYDLQYVVALDKKTGRTVWKADRTHDYQTDDGDQKKGFATPIVIEAAGRSQLISPAAKAVVSLDPLTGRELWRVRYEQHSAATRPLFAHGLVYVDTGFSKADLLAIRPDGRGDVTATHVAWKATKGIGAKPFTAAGRRPHLFGLGFGRGRDLPRRQDGGRGLAAPGGRRRALGFAALRRRRRLRLCGGRLGRGFQAGPPVRGAGPRRPRRGRRHGHAGDRRPVGLRAHRVAPLSDRGSPVAVRTSRRQPTEIMRSRL